MASPLKKSPPDLRCVVDPLHPCQYVSMPQVSTQLFLSMSSPHPLMCAAVVTCYPVQVPQARMRQSTPSPLGPSCPQQALVLQQAPMAGEAAVTPWHQSELTPEWSSWLTKSPVPRQPPVAGPKEAAPPAGLCWLQQPPSQKGWPLGVCPSHEEEGGSSQQAITSESATASSCICVALVPESGTLLSA